MMHPDAPAGGSAPAAAAGDSGSTAANPGSAAGSPDPQGKTGSRAPASAAANPSGAPAAGPELFELKIDGKVVKMTREQIIQEASKGHVADKRFQEAAQLRKQAETVIGRLRDPKQVIAALQDPALGLSKDQIRTEFEEWYSREFIEPEKLSPEEKKLREAEARLKRYEEEDRQRQEQKVREQNEAMTAKARQELQTQLIEALETGALPKTNFTIRRLAYWIQRNNDNGFNAPTDVLVSQVRNDFNTSMREMVENSDGEVLIKLLGDNIIQKLRKYDLEQLRKLRQGPAAQGTQESAPAPAAAKSERPPTSAEVNERIRQLQRTGRY